MLVGIMVNMSFGAISMSGIMGAVPVCMPFWRGLLKDKVAFWAEDIVPQAKILMKEECSFGDPSMTILALNFIRMLLDVLGVVALDGGLGYRATSIGDIQTEPVSPWCVRLLATFVVLESVDRDV